MEIMVSKMDNNNNNNKIDATFRKISKNSICFEIWKMEEERLESEAKSSYGTFYTHCVYLIYAAGPHGAPLNQNTITQEKKAGCLLERFIHIWVGKKVSKEQRNIVTTKMHELDLYFGNKATQFYESETNETARFLSYFTNGIKILCNSINPSPNCNRLYQLYGCKGMRCIETLNISWNHFASDNIMLLQTPKDIFLWFGRFSSIYERRLAMELLENFKNQNMELNIIDDGYEQSLPEEKKIIWNNILPTNKRVVQQCLKILEKQNISHIRIFKSTFKSGRLFLDELDITEPRRDQLNDSTTFYLIDCFPRCVWIWVGTQSTIQNKNNALMNGRHFIKKKKYPWDMPIIRVIEDNEPKEFIRLFPNWFDNLNSYNNTYKSPVNDIGKYDSITLSQRLKMAAEIQLIDNGVGERVIYRITKKEISEIPSNTLFFSTNHCYIVLYMIAIASNNETDIENVGIKNVIFEWCGKQAHEDAIRKSEKFCKENFDSLCERTMMVRMHEDHETPQFLQIFNGKFIILKSSNNPDHNQNIKNSLSKNLKGSLSEKIIFKVYGNSSYNSKAVEVHPNLSLTSSECYVIKVLENIWVWCGQATTGDARESAKKISSIFGEGMLMMEGKETKQFQDAVNSALNLQIILSNDMPSNTSSNEVSSSLSNSIATIGHQSQQNESIIKKVKQEPQLYLIWGRRGTFYSQHIIGLSQQDLSPESIYILDADSIVYIWFGKFTPKVDKDNWANIINLFLKSIPMTQRSLNSISLITQNNEPSVFIGFFEHWNRSLWNDFVTYEQVVENYRMQDGRGQTSGDSGIGDTNNCNGHSTFTSSTHNLIKEFDRNHKYQIPILQQETELLPIEVNPLKRELHLTHDDFVSIFNMSFWEFEKLPDWKKQELKKKYKLF